MKNNSINKYYSKFKKDNTNENVISIKRRNYNFSLPKGKKTLREKLNKNKTPKRDIIGNYISKKRVEKYSEENYLTFNKNIFHQINKNQCYYAKQRFYNNESEIKKIQNFWRKMSIYNNIFMKPITNDLDNTKKINIDKKENKISINSDKLTPKKLNKLPYINSKNKNNIINQPFYNKSYSNRKNIFQNQYDNDEYLDNNNEEKINNLANNIANNNENVVNSSDISYINKIRKINLLKYILLLQNNIRNFIKRIKYIKKNNQISSYVSKYRLNITTYNKFLKFIKESKTIIKIEKNYIYNPQSKNKENISLNHTDINFITKIRYSNYISDIEKIQRNWRMKLKSKISYKKIRPKKNIMTKIRIRNNENKILFIQEIIRKRIFAKYDEKNKTVSRKSILSNSLYNKKRYSKSCIKQNSKTNEIKGNKNKINKKLRQNMDNYMNNIKLNNLDKMNKKKDNSKENSNYDSNSSSVKSFNKKDFSYAKINYITKIYKCIIYKRQLNIIGNFMSKEYKIEYKKKKDFSFLFLLNLFIIKNTQEYIYYLLKYNTEKIFQYPFYNKSLERIIKYLRSSKNDLNSSKELDSGEKIKKLFIKLFPSLYSQKPPSILISSLEPESKNQLIKSNIYNTIEPDFVNFLNDFSKYDKNLSNIAFIETRLKNTKLINTNIFTIIKFLDDEYANLIYGKYCFKCFLDLNKCSCEKNKFKKDEEYYYSDIDNIIDIEFDPYYFNKQPNEYDSTKWKDISIKRKPKTEEAYEDPFTHLIIKTKEQLNEGKRMTINSMNNTNDSFFGTNSYTSYNSRILNKIKNDLENDNSMNNSKNIAKIKAIYHQTTGKKKENLILIKNNDY